MNTVEEGWVVSDGYKILNQVASGSHGNLVLRARRKDGDIVAIKAMPRSDLHAVACHMDECRLGQAFTHTNIVRTLGCCHMRHQQKPHYGLVMEFVAGPCLEQTLTHWPLPPLVAVEIAQDIARALDHVHGAEDEECEPLHAVHWDVKPANILLAPTHAKLTDFGSAQFRDQRNPVRPGRIRGTSSYMAPEQVQGLPPTSASDIFSLGTVLHDVCTGQRAFAYAGDWRITAFRVSGYGYADLMASYRRIKQAVGAAVADVAMLCHAHAEARPTAEELAMELSLTAERLRKQGATFGYAEWRKSLEGPIMAMPPVRKPVFGYSSF